MDEQIAKDITETERDTNVLWIQKSVTIHQADNPFFLPQFPEINYNDNTLENVSGRVLAERQNIMSIDFPNACEPRNSDNGHGIGQFIDSQSVNLSSTEINAPFDLSSRSSVYDSSSVPAITDCLSHFVVSLDHFETPFDFVEPILCSAFLYSPKQKAIVSEVWNFFPQQSEQFLVDAGLDPMSTTSVTFEVDPITTRRCILIVLLSRPVTQDRGKTVNQYYEDPTEANKQMAKDMLAKTFPRLNKLYQTFAFTFNSFWAVTATKVPLKLPQAYLVNRCIAEKDIGQLLMDVNSRKMQQVKMNLWFVKGTCAQLVVRQISEFRASPFFAPINQLYVKLDKLTLSDPEANKDKEILIGIALKDSNDGDSLPVIRSRFAPMIASEIEFSRCAFDVTNPFFDDSFVLNLPYPLPPQATLAFTIYRASLASESGAAQQILTASIPLFQEGCPGLIIDNTTYHLNVSNGDTLSIKTFLRSSLLQTNRKLKALLTNPHHDFLTLGVIPPKLLIEYMFPIFDVLVDGMYEAYRDMIDVFMRYWEQIKDTLPLEKFVKLMLAYLKFYSFRVSSSSPNPRPPAPIDVPEKPQFSSPPSPTVKDMSVLEQYRSAGGYPGLRSKDFSPKFRPAASSRAASVVSEFEGDVAEFSFPSKILFYMKLALAKNNDAITTMSPMFDFFFLLIVKWLDVRSEEFSYDEILPEFCEVYTNKAIELGSSTTMMKSISVFATLLFDIGRCSAALAVIQNVVKVLREKEELADQLMAFISDVFKPRFFVFMARNSEEFRQLIVTLVSDAYSAIASQRPQARLFRVILHIVNVCGDTVKKGLANALIGLVEKFKPSQIAQCTASSLIDALLLFDFLVTTADNIPLNLGTMNALHFVLMKIKEKGVVDLITESKPVVKPSTTDISGIENPAKGVRLRRGTVGATVRQPPGLAPKPTTPVCKLPRPQVRSPVVDHKQQEKLNNFVQYTIKNALTLMKNMSQKTLGNRELGYVVGVLYHLLFVGESDSFNEEVFEAMESLLTKYELAFMEISSPCLIKIVEKALRLSIRSPAIHKPVENFITAFYKVDYKLHNNMNMANMVMTRCLTLFSVEELQSPGLAALISVLRGKEAFKLMASKYDELAQERIYLDIYAHCEYFWFKFLLLRESPDAQCQVLEEMYNFHMSEGREMEAAAVTVMEAALVIEYLTVLKRLPNYFNRAHACSILTKLCPNVSQIVENQPYENLASLPVMPGFCDSQFFSSGGLSLFMSRTVEIYKSKKLYDLVADIMDIVWPIQEYWHSYTELSGLFGNIGAFLSSAVMGIDTADMFYKVKINGGYENNKEFIYRAKPMTRLQDFKVMLLENYSKTYGNENVEVVSKSDTIDQAKLDRGMIIFQITSVEPFRKDTQQVGRFFKHFCDKIPFVKGEKRAHGEIHEQWIRRELYETNQALPNIFGRAEIISQTTKEYSPIQNAYTQLRQRYQKTQEALDMQNMDSLLMIFKGTVCPEVNSGPEKFIEVFLTSKEKTKYTAKLAQAIVMLVKQGKDALQVIANYCTQNPEYMPLQEMLELGYDSLKKAILSYQGK